MIVIKDMEMPKSCFDCPTCEIPGSLCVCKVGHFTFERKKEFTKKRHSNCPLEEREERKVGKWIYDKTSQNWRCSVCNETPKTLGYVGTSAFMTEHFKFCNHCGAEMRGAENE